MKFKLNRKQTLAITFLIKKQKLTKLEDKKNHLKIYNLDALFEKNSDFKKLNFKK